MLMKGLTSAEWKQKDVRYLGIKFSDNVKELVDDNVFPYMINLKNQLEHLGKKILWWGRMAVVKMKILPVLLFLFQNLMVPISMKHIDTIQKMLNDFFFWQNKKT